MGLAWVLLIYMKQWFGCITNQWPRMLSIISWFFLSFPTDLCCSTWSTYNVFATTILVICCPSTSKEVNITRAGLAPFPILWAHLVGLPVKDTPDHHTTISVWSQSSFSLIVTKGGAGKAIIDWKLNFAIFRKSKRERRWLVAPFT